MDTALSSPSSPLLREAQAFVFDAGLVTAAFLGGLAVVAGALPGRAVTWAAVAATLLAGGLVCVAGAPVGWSTLALWLLMWVNVSLYDVRDRDADRAAGVRTLAVLLKPGVHGALTAAAMIVSLGLSWGIGGPFWAVMGPVGVLHLGAALWVRRHAFPDILDVGLDGGGAAMVLAHLLVGG